METSAKTAMNVNEIFLAIGKCFQRIIYQMHEKWILEGNVCSKRVFGDVGFMSWTDLCRELMMLALCRARRRSSARTFTCLINPRAARKRYSNYTRKNAWSVTAFNSTDIRTVKGNLATPVTAMMVTVCISTDALSSVFISPDLSDANSFHQCCWSIIPVTACSYTLQQSVPNIRLMQPWQPIRLFQSDTVSSEQSVGDNSLIQLWYHTCIRPEGATGCNRSVAFLRMYFQFNLPRALDK